MLNAKNPPRIFVEDIYKLITWPIVHKRTNRRTKTLIYISAHNSPSLDDNSYIRFDESCVSYITITDTDEDASEELNKHIHIDCEGYPTWDKLSLCLRTDWKRIGLWPVKEGNVLTIKLEAEFRKVFDKPAIVGTVAGLLATYAACLHNESRQDGKYARSISNVYCLNKDEYFTLNWCFIIKDQCTDEEGLQKFREALVIGSITEAIERVTWAYYH